jgi:hypothetical protein
MEGGVNLTDASLKRACPIASIAGRRVGTVLGEVDSLKVADETAWDKSQSGGTACHRALGGSVLFPQKRL